MYTHVLVGTNDPEKSRAFYDATFAELGIAGQHTPKGAIYGAPGSAMFGVTTPRDAQAATHANGGTIGFTAPDKAAVDGWHKAGLAHGGRDEGEPGPRENGPISVYGAYLRDPDGNKLCVSCPAGA